MMPYHGARGKPLETPPSQGRGIFPGPGTDPGIFPGFRALLAPTLASLNIQ